LVLEAWWPGVGSSSLRWPLYVGCCGGSTPLLGDQVGAWLLLLENVNKCGMS